MKLLLFTLVLFSSVAVFAQVAPAVTSTPAGQSVISAVTTATTKVPSTVPTGLIMVLSFVLTELAARGVPTQKPVSWFLFAEGLIAAVVALLQKVQSLLTSMGTAFNNTSGPAT
jgi:hypothetical protein